MVESFLKYSGTNRVSIGTNRVSIKKSGVMEAVTSGERRVAGTGAAGGLGCFGSWFRSWLHVFFILYSGRGGVALAFTKGRFSKMMKFVDV